MGIKPGEVRINGLVFINDTPVTLKKQPPIIHQPREVAATRQTPTTRRTQKPALTHHHHKALKVKHHVLHPSGHGALAPGASKAVQAALGPNGPGRIGRILTNPGDKYSAGTHTRSGYLTGQDGSKTPYGCAFDVSVAGETSAQAQQTARELRLQGIAAWYRAPGSESGMAGSGSHIHCVWPGAPTDNEQNEQQISSFIHGYQGLANAANPKSSWIDPTITPDEIRAVEAAYAQGDHSAPLSQVPSYDSVHTSLHAKKRSR